MTRAALSQSLFRGAVICLGLVAGSRAWANGAFPASSGLFLPPERPDKVVLATNFGLIATNDGGKVWTWMCEHGAGSLANLYQQAAPPGRRLFAVAPAGLVYTDDDACSWTASAGVPASATVSDDFCDPSDGARVLSVIRRVDNGMESIGLYASTDSGASVGATPLYTAPAGKKLDSVEIARSDRMRVYGTISSTNSTTAGPQLLRSEDGGKTWTPLDATSVTGTGELRIAAVDPVDANKLYLRFTGTGAGNVKEHIVISEDGGRSLRIALTVEDVTQFSAFLRRQGGTTDGTLLVAAVDGLTGFLYRSTDGGRSFSQLGLDVQVRALAERDGVLHAAADGITDPFMIGVSRDNGDSFSPLAKLTDIQGVKACAADMRGICRSSCDMLVNYAVFTGAICDAVAGSPPSDAGAPPAGDGAMADATTGPQPDAGPGDAGAGGDRATPTPKSSGCSCAAASDGGASPAAALLLLAIAIAVAISGAARMRARRRS